MTRKTLRRLDPTEADTLKAICDWLDVQQRQGRLLYIRHNPPMMTSKRVDGKTKVIFKKVRESQLGAPDLMVFKRNQYPRLADWENKGVVTDVLCIEVKSPTGKMSAYQDCWCGMAIDQGMRHIIARSLEEVIKALG